MSNRLENLVGALALHISDSVQDGGNAALSESVAAPGAALTLIGHNPGISILWLSRGLLMSHPGAVRLVDRLVDANLVERRRTDEDGRAASLWLTEKGSDFCRRLFEQRAESVGEILKCLSSTERYQLEKISQKLLKFSCSDEAMAVRTCRWCDGDVCSDCPVEAAIQE